MPKCAPLDEHAAGCVCLTPEFAMRPEAGCCSAAFSSPPLQPQRSKFVLESCALDWTKFHEIAAPFPARSVAFQLSDPLALFDAVKQQLL